MLRLLSWIYDLGVEQERQRIARALEREVASRNQHIAILRNALSDPKTGSKAKASLEFRDAVDCEIRDIINEMFRVKFYENTGDSVVFPKGEKKGV